MKSIARNLSRTGRVGLVAGAIGVIAAMGVAGWALQGRANETSRSTSVSFNGSYSSTSEVTPGDPGCTAGTHPVLETLAGAGNATELGSFSLVASHCFDGADTNKPQIPFTNGQGTYTVANGDTFTTRYDGYAEPSAPGVLRAVAQGTITGGTGRFAGATGTVAATGTFSLGTGRGNVTLEGTLTTIRSDE